MSIKISDTASLRSGDKPIKANTYVSLNMKVRQHYEVDGFLLNAKNPNIILTEVIVTETPKTFASYKP